MRVAITRGVSPTIGNCELTLLEREEIDVETARAQHSLYEGLLEGLGCRVEHLAEDPGFPDSVFVEDIAVVLDEIAIITRPGALSRRGERPSIERALATHRPTSHIQAPGILDGGDVLTVAKNIYVGLSTRSNAEAVRQLRALVADHGYRVIETEFRGCLHLKSAVTTVSDDTLLINPEWIDAGTFQNRTASRLIRLNRTPPMSFALATRSSSEPTSPGPASVSRLGVSTYSP